MSSKVIRLSDRTLKIIDKYKEHLIEHINEYDLYFIIDNSSLDDLIFSVFQERICDHVAKVDHSNFEKSIYSTKFE